MAQTANQPSIKSPITSQAGVFKKNIVKIIIAVLAIALAAELFFGGTALFSPSNTKNLSILAPRVNALSGANLSLVLDKKVYKRGDPVVIGVKLFTGGYTTDSTDLVIKYDPAFLEPNSEKFAESGNIYSEYPAIQIDKEKGLVGISGITTPGSNSFQGVGSFAKLNFRALKDGQTEVSIDFEPDKTADSNVVLSGSSKDILGSVKNADILIAGSDAQPPKGNDKRCDSFTQYCQNSQGNTGTQVCSGGSTKAGSCGYDPEFSTRCEPCKTE